MAKYLLYWHPMTSSYAPHAVLEELGVEYETKFIDYLGGEHKKPEFLKINPNGMLPVLLIENKTIIYESGAIVMYLADYHQNLGLAPSLDSPSRPFYNQWLFYLSSMVFQTYTRYYQSEFYSSNPNHGKEIKAKAFQDLLTRWQIVEDALVGKNWLLGEKFSVCDIYLQMLTSWHIPREVAKNSNDLLSDEFFDEFPQIKRIINSVLARSAMKKISALYPSEDLANYQP